MVIHSILNYLSLRKTIKLRDHHLHPFIRAVLDPDMREEYLDPEKILGSEYSGRMHEEIRRQYSEGTRALINSVRDDTQIMIVPSLDVICGICTIPQRFKSCTIPDADKGTGLYYSPAYEVKVGDIKPFSYFKARYPNLQGKIFFGW